MGQSLEAHIEEGKRIAERLRAEALWAQQTWSLWEAINGTSAHDRSDFRQALNYLGLGGPFHTLRHSLVRDCLLTLYRMTDQDSEAHSLCAIVRLLWDDAVCARLSGRDWFLDCGYPDFLIDSEMAAQPERIQLVRRLVSRKWSGECLRDRSLYRLRQSFKDLRNKTRAPARL